MGGNIHNSYAVTVSKGPRSSFVENRTEAILQSLESERNRGKERDWKQAAETAEKEITMLRERLGVAEQEV
jgi:hypothetical protein